MVRLSLIQPIDAATTNLTGSSTLLSKFIKHTAPLQYAGLISVFFWGEYEKYQNFTVSGTLSGSLQVDSQNRKNLIWYAGRDVGITYDDGKYVVPNDAVKVVLSDNPLGIHAFPVNYELQYVERCVECDRIIPP